MGKKKKKPINLNELEEEEKMKYEIAEELGLLDRVLAQGLEITYFQRDREDRRTGDKKEDGRRRTGQHRRRKNIENRKQKGLILTKPLIFDKMLRMGSMVG